MENKKDIKVIIMTIVLILVVLATVFIVFNYFMTKLEKENPANKTTTTTTTPVKTYLFENSKSYNFENYETTKELGYIKLDNKDYVVYFEINDNKAAIKIGDKKIELDKEAAGRGTIYLLPDAIMVMEIFPSDAAKFIILDAKLEEKINLNVYNLEVNYETSIITYYLPKCDPSNTEEYYHINFKNNTISNPIFDESKPHTAGWTC